MRRVFACRWCRIVFVNSKENCLQSAKLIFLGPSLRARDFLKQLAGDIEFR